MSDSEIPVVSAGPYLTLAAFFESVIKEDNGVLTLVRMIDRITVSTNHSWIASLPPSQVSANLVVSFRGQDLQRSGIVSIQPRKPSGAEMPKMEIPFVFDAQTGVNLNIELGMLADEEGYYWFDVLLDDELVTRTPLQIVFQPAIEGGEGDSEGSS